MLWCPVSNVQKPSDQGGVLYGQEPKWRGLHSTGVGWGVGGGGERALESHNLPVLQTSF